jgi:hypothetical protein
MSLPTYANTPLPTNVAFQVADQNNLVKGQAVLVATVLGITAAQLLALRGADVTLIPAPVAGLANVVDSISLRINFGTVAYTLNAGTLKVFQGPSANGIALTGDLSALLTQAVSSDNIGVPALATGVQTKVNSEAQPIVLGNTGAAQFTLGDGTLDIVVTYNVVQM